MGEIYQKGISLIRKLISKGFFHVFLGNTLVKIVSMSSAILLPRILGTENAYGMLSTVDNINSYLILINGCGLANSVLRFCAMVDDKEQKTAVFNFCLKGGLLVDGVLVFLLLPLLVFSSFFSGGNYGAAKNYIAVASFIPMLTYVHEVLLLYMRANLLNKEYSKASVLFTLFYAGLQILCSYFWLLNGVYIGRYIALVLIITICFFVLYRKERFSKVRYSLAKDEKKKIVLYGFGTMIGNAFSLMMPYNETLVVNVVLQDLSATAYYKAASMIPSNLQFIATSVVIFVFPYFARHTKDWRWVRNKSISVLLGVLIIMLPIMIIGYILSPQIILHIYGENYNPAIEIMKPMWIAFGINAIIRIPLGNILAALGELRFNNILSVFICLIHLCLDFCFISSFGMRGAAYALMISYTISSLCSIIYIFLRSGRG